MASSSSRKVGGKTRSKVAAKLARVVRERVGEEPSQALEAFVDEVGREVKAEVMDAVTERFGRMLAEECGKLRTEAADQFGKVRTEAAEQFGKLRTETAEQFGKLRTEVAEQGARFEVRLAEQRAELLKWSFLFWIGQVAAMAALLAFMLRGLPR